MQRAAPLARPVRRFLPAGSLGRRPIISVELAGEDGKATTRIVKTGVQSDKAVEITDGLQEGDQIMIQGTTTRVPNGGGPVVPGVGGRAAQPGR